MKVELTSNFEVKIQEYLTTITKDNFYSKYEGLQSLITEYNHLGLSRSKILEILSSHYSKSNDDYKEEVVGELMDCIEGFTSPNKIINLKE